MRTLPLRERDRNALFAAIVCAVGGVLVWALWVLPLAGSVRDAQPVDAGASIIVEARAGERLGIWSDSPAVHFGTLDCRVDGAGEPETFRGPSLDWEDTLWWFTPRFGFRQFAAFAAPEDGAYAVTCADSLHRYEGQFLVAGDSFGGGSLGLGRTGGADFPMGSILAYTAVVAPLVAVLLGLILAIRGSVALIRRRHARAHPVGSSFGTIVLTESDPR